MYQDNRDTETSTTAENHPFRKGKRNGLMSMENFETDPGEVFRKVYLVDRDWTYRQEPRKYY